MYACLFTCAVSRAIHLEVVMDLTVECFLHAFRRFASRRSTPRLMLSDNASIYLVAAEKLQNLLSSAALTESQSEPLGSEFLGATDSTDQLRQLSRRL